MKLKVYYIEDSSLHFNSIAKEFEQSKFLFLPSYANWENDVQLFRVFLQNSNNENKQNLVNLLGTYNADLFIIDISLWHNSMGGTTIYDSILSVEEQFNIKPVIFLTLPESLKITYTAPNIKLEHKIQNNDGSINFSKTSENLQRSIKELLNIKDTFFDDVLDIYNQ